MAVVCGADILAAVEMYVSATYEAHAGKYT
jgi:hypothetical protein